MEQFKAVGASQKQPGKEYQGLANEITNFGAQNVETVGKTAQSRVKIVHPPATSSSDDVMEEIENCCNVMVIPFNENEIDRAHGIRKPFLYEEGKKKVRPVIVKYKFWKGCAAFYKARPQSYVNGRKKPGLT